MVAAAVLAEEEEQQQRHLLEEDRDDPTKRSLLKVSVCLIVCFPFFSFFL